MERDYTGHMWIHGVPGGWRFNIAVTGGAIRSRLTFEQAVAVVVKAIEEGREYTGNQDVILAAEEVFLNKTVAPSPVGQSEGAA